MAHASEFWAVCPQRAGNCMTVAMATDSSGAAGLRIARIGPSGEMAASVFFSPPGYPDRLIQLAEGGITRIDANRFALSGLILDDLIYAQLGFIALCDSNGTIYHYRDIGIDFPAYKQFMWVAQIAYDGRDLVVLSHFSVAAGAVNQVLTKYDTSLHTLWAKRYAEGDYPSKAAFNLLVDSSGYVVAGASMSTFIGDHKAYKEQAVVFRTDTTGELLWTYKSTAMLSEAAHIAHTGDGGYVFGSMGNIYDRRASAPGDIADWRAQDMIVKLDATGKEAWAMPYTPGRYTGWGSSRISLLQQDSGFLSLEISGVEDSTARINDIAYAVLRHYSDSGKLLWQRRYQEPLDTPLRAIIKLYDLTPLDDGALMLAGTLNNMKAGVTGPFQRGWLIRVDSNGCMGPDDPQCTPLSVADLPVPGQLQLSLYPNPSAAMFYASYQLQHPAQLYITDLKGQLLLRQNLPPGAGQFSIDARDWPPGVYLYRLSDAIGNVMSGKLLRY